MQSRTFGRILSIIVLASFCLSACKCQQKNPPIQVPTPPVLQALPVLSEGMQWVKKMLSQYPELAWLKKTEVHTEEGKESYSKLIYGQKFVDFDHSLMSLYCLKLILDGREASYQEFTAAQPQNLKLSRESFEALHEQGMNLLKANYQNISSAEMQKTMEVAIILKDIIKSEKARAIFQKYGAHATDQEDFHAEAMGILKINPRLSRTFSQLSYSGKQLLIKIANLGSYEQITHLEGGPSVFGKLKMSSIAATDPIALSFDLFIHTCDFAGLGHVNQTSSTVYTQQAHLAIQAMGEACRVLSDPTKTEADAYDAYIAVRASWLGLNPYDRDDRVLTRIGAMLRLFTPEEGDALKKAIHQLSMEELEQIIAQLDVRLGEEIGRTPTAMPDVLVNLYNNKGLGETSTERLSQAVIRGLPFIAKVLEQHKQNPAVPLNFNEVAVIAKSTPDLLLINGFQIEPNGNVIVQ